MINKKLAILFSGTGSNFAYILEHLHLRGFEVVVAITNNPQAKGIEIAKNNNIPLEIIDSKLFKDREEFDRVLVDRLDRYNPHLTILAGFMRILTPHFTDNVKSINLHPSLLPRHKGLKAIEKSYEDEYEFGGVSVHWVSSELDGGEIILQKKIKKDGLTFEEYNYKIRKVEKEILVKAIKSINLG